MRFGAAILGCAFFLISSLMPILGAGARHEIRCGHREFTGSFDECFNDMIPVLPMAAPIFGLIFVFSFAAFASALWAVPIEEGRSRWLRAGENSAEENWPLLQIASAAGAVWAFYQGQAYRGHEIGLPFFIFWNAFSTWFAAGTLCALPATIYARLVAAISRLLRR